MEATGAMDSLLKKLGDLLAEEYSRLKGVRREIRFLRSELNSMNAVLQKCAAMESPDIQVKAWTRELRELAYDIEDCVDEFVHGVDTKQRHGPRASCFKEFFREFARRLKALVTRHKIANQIQDLKARVEEVAKQRERYKLLDDVSSSSACIRATDPRLCAVFAEESHLVGIDGPRDDLASWLVAEDENGRRKVLSIYGFGGLGKTTLANEVRRKIGKQFDCDALVPVSQKPDNKKILRNILTRVEKRSTLGKERETWDEQMIIEKIRDLLEDKRYFIIIDDLWSQQDWNFLKCALPENSKGSRIITTTRIESVARACSSLPSDRCYKIEPLSELHSRSLLFKKVFGFEDGCPDRIKGVSADILRKCSGLPLAIVSIASLLASKANMMEQWEKVRVSTGYVLQTKQDHGVMESILSLSYSDLPQHLKTCLLYLSVFPEDYDIERGSLLRRWVAEGFVKEEPGLIAEDVAESYFNELINRSMIIPVDIGYDGRVQVCRVHDMMLELMKKMATEENFVTVIGPTKPEGVIRRLSIQYNDGEQKLKPQEMPSLTHVSSLSVFGGYHNQTLPFAYFRVLRVLSLDSHFSGADDLKIICKLHQLKYLRLNASELPAEIGELQCLETLEWCNYYRWGNLLPQGVARLQHLRHLLVDGEGMLPLPEGIGRIQALQTLSLFNICDSPVSAVQELGNLENLREFSISWDPSEPADARYKEYLASSLNKLSSYSLQSLSIFSEGAIPVDFLASLSPPPYLKRFWMWNSYFQRCPEWIGPLDRLTELKLDVWEMKDEDLDLLGDLPALVNFHLWVVPVRKEKIIIKRSGFRSLISFLLWSGLPCLVFQEKSMPRLETLKLKFSACGAKSYGSTHSGIKHLDGLKNVYVEIFTTGAIPSNIEAAYHKICQEIAKHPNNVRTNIITVSNEFYMGGVMNDGNVDEEAIVHYTVNNGDNNLHEDNQFVHALGSQSIEY